MIERDLIFEEYQGINPDFFIVNYLRASFSKDVKKKVHELQGGVSPTGQPIDEFHHVVPQNMLKKSMGISGKDVVENCVGLGFEEHKHKWDPLAAKGIFFDWDNPNGVTLSEIDPETYKVVNRKLYDRRK